MKITKESAQTMGVEVGAKCIVTKENGYEAKTAKGKVRTKAEVISLHEHGFRVRTEKGHTEFFQWSALRRGQTDFVEMKRRGTK